MALDVQNQDPLPKYPHPSSSSHSSSTSSTCDRDDDGLVTLDLFSTSKRNKSSSFSLLQSQDQPNLLLNNKVQGDHHHLQEAKVRFNPTKQKRHSQEDKYYYYLINIMSHQRSNEGNNNNNINVPPKLDLRLNLSPPRPAGGHHLIMVGPESPTRSPSISPPSSCLSSELMINDPPPAIGGSQLPKYSSSPEATSMVLVGCPRCLMYVMLSEDDPKCPKCKSTVLLDFLSDNTTKTNTNSNTNTAVNHGQSAAAAATKRTRKS